MRHCRRADHLIKDRGLADRCLAVRSDVSRLDEEEQHKIASIKYQSQAACFLSRKGRASVDHISVPSISSIAFLHRARPSVAVSAAAEKAGTAAAA
jgi:hypothetical protein